MPPRKNKRLQARAPRLHFTSVNKSPRKSTKRSKIKPNTFAKTFGLNYDPSTTLSSSSISLVTDPRNATTPAKPEKGPTYTNLGDVHPGDLQSTSAPKENPGRRLPKFPKHRILMEESGGYSDSQEISKLREEITKS